MTEYTLVGIDGNAFAIISYVMGMLRHERFPRKMLNAYKEKAMSGNYNNLLCLSIDMVDMVNRKLRADNPEEFDDYDEYYE